MNKTYVIHVEFSDIEELPGLHTTTLTTQATNAELGLLLHALDMSPIVAALNVYSTPVSPVHTSLGRLTRTDLGFDEYFVTKLK